MALDGSGYLSHLLQLNVAHLVNVCDLILAEFPSFLGFPDLPE